MLTVENLEVVYSDVIVTLRGISLEVPEGGIVALLGANGAGKTTCLRAISGLLDIHDGEITKGEVTFDGERLDGRDAAEIVRKGIAQVLEGRRIFAELTVDENLKTGAFTRRDGAGVRRSYERVMELFPVLAERRKGVAGYLSGGEQQMLAVARALMARPRLLVLDEPSTGLAPALVDELYAALAVLHRDGLSLLVAEQHLPVVLRLAARGYVLEHGRVRLAGPATALRADPAVRAAYLGAP